MKYYSTNKKATPVNFKEATIKGQAPDRGLYFPEKIPSTHTLVGQLEHLSQEEIAFRVIQPYVDNEIPEEELFTIVREAINFPIPLIKVSENTYSLELFHGPTLAFKDVGARFMSRCLGWFLQNESQKVTVLVATSGDTGGAVANGFYNVEGIDVVILYPSGKVSPVQEKQLTTLGKNIHTLEVKGTFDDCQQLVKQAFADDELRNKFFLTSANSINIARWLPQQVYYFLAFKQWPEKNSPPSIAVPSGNLGNICAGMLAMQSGLPIKHFIAACNINDVVSTYLETKQLTPKQATATLSNAMDVGNPSNFVRILELFHHKFSPLKAVLSSRTVTDAETVNTISEVYKNFHYLLDPHGAVGYFALQQHLMNSPLEKGIFLETAHPVKFSDAVEKITGTPIEIPPSIRDLINGESQQVLINPLYKELRDFLLR